MQSAIDHLLAELDWLDGLLARRVAWLRQTGRFTEDPFRGLYTAGGRVDALPAPEAEQEGDIALRRRLDDGAGAAEGGGVVLPLRRLARRFALDAFEQAVLLLAAAA